VCMLGEAGFLGLLLPFFFYLLSILHFRQGGLNQRRAQRSEAKTSLERMINST
jgi:hypothetical protein